MTDFGATVEAIAEALEPYDIPTGSWTAAERLEPARAVAAALPDPRPPEAEVMMGYGLTPYQLERLRALGCFRPEPAAPIVHDYGFGGHGQGESIRPEPQEDPRG